MRDRSAFARVYGPSCRYAARIVEFQANEWRLLTVTDDAWQAVVFVTSEASPLLPQAAPQEPSYIDAAK